MLRTHGMCFTLLRRKCNELFHHETLYRSADSACGLGFARQAPVLPWDHEDGTFPLLSARHPHGRAVCSSDRQHQTSILLGKILDRSLPLQTVSPTSHAVYWKDLTARVRF